MNGNIDFKLDTDKYSARPIIELYGMSALVDNNGAENIIVGLPESDMITLWNGIKTNHYTHVDGINATSEENSLGVEFLIPHFQLGLVEYWNIPIVVKDIQHTDVDIVLGGALFGPGAYAYHDKEHDCVIFHFPEMIARTGKLWTKDDNGNWVFMERVKNSFAMPIKN